MDLNKIEDSIVNSLKNAGYDIVRVKYFKNNLEIMIENTNGTPISIKDCSLATKIVTPILFDLLGDGIFLEVSSPGINRPIVKLTDYEKYSNYHVKITFQELYQKKNTKLTGKLIFHSADSINLIDNDGNLHNIDVNNVVNCELDSDKNKGEKIEK